MEVLPIAVFWCVVGWSLFQPKHVLLHVFFASLPFGSLAAVPTAWTGGFTLVPTTVIAALLIGRHLYSGRGLARALDMALRPSAALLLFMFWIVAGITTLFMPRFFEGQVAIISLAHAEVVALQPTSQNLSQFVYISISVLVTFSFADMLDTAAARQRALVALCLGASMMVLTGFLDYASQHLPLTSTLELFRTANYALLTADEIMNSKRVVGLMPEASAFGTTTLGFLASLYFFRRAMPAVAMRDRLVPILMGLLLLLVWLSTSSAGYVGLCVLSVAAVAEWCWRVLAANRNVYLRKGLASEFWLSAMGVGLLLLLVLAVPKVLEPIVRMFDFMVMQKSQSSSYEERSMWTRVSWNALLATYGMGVGMGGTRASNFMVALGSNAGLLAATFYFLFVIQCLFGRRVPRADAEGHALLSAIRWSYLPPFLVSLTIGTTPDFGVFNAFLYGFSIALASRASRGPTGSTQTVRSGSTSTIERVRPVPGQDIRLD